jgi:hypothetical protein
MDPEHIASLVLRLGATRGKRGIESVFGTSLFEVLATVFGELHKNNLPEEEFLFALKAAFDDPDNHTVGDLSLANMTPIKSLRDTLSKTKYYSDYGAERVDPSRQIAVLEDFVYLVTKAIHSDPELFEMTNNSAVSVLKRHERS